MRIDRFYDRRRTSYNKVSLRSLIKEAEQLRHVEGHKKYNSYEEYIDLKNSIRRAAIRLNKIVKACKELDLKDEGKYVDPDRLDITYRTLENLYDKIYDAKRMLDIYKSELDYKLEIEEKNYDSLDPDEVKDSDIFDTDETDEEDIFDDLEDNNLNNDSEEKSVSNLKFNIQSKSSLPEYNPNDDIKTLFFKTMQYFWMTRSENELIDDYAFYMNLKNEPDVDYFVVPITGFTSDRSIVFNVLSIDGEEQTHLEPTISVDEIDFEEDHTDFADLVEIFKKETYR